jgi:polyhydroxyalkanoate synthesis regulator phasin
MGGAAQKPQEKKLTETEQKFVDQLVAKNYTAEQARDIINIVQRMRSGQDVQLNPQQSRWVNDIQAINDRWNSVSPSTSRVSQLKLNEVDRILAVNVKGPGETPKTRQEAAPAVVKTFTYAVTLDDRTYKVESKAELVSRGMTTVEGSRTGQLARLLANNPKEIVGIVAPGGEVLQPGSEKFQDFTSQYLRAYNEVRSNPESERISIEALKKKG